MIKLEIKSVSIDMLPQVAQQIIATANKQTIWTFYGEMGAGKTTLIKQICKQLGVVDDISSPTYSLVNEYKTQTGNTIFHFDFYRIKNLEEVYDIGYEDYFYSNNICLIEWPEKIEALIKYEDFLHVAIEKKDTDLRHIIISRNSI